MDFTKFDIEKAASNGVEVPIIFWQTGEPLSDEDGTPIVFTVCGQDSSRWVNVRREEHKKLAKRNKQLDLSDPDQVNAMNQRILSQCVLSFTGNISWDGKALECEPESLYDFFSQPGNTWVVEQINVATNNRKNLKVIGADV